MAQYVFIRLFLDSIPDKHVKMMRGLDKTKATQPAHNSVNPPDEHLESKTQGQSMQSNQRQKNIRI